MINEKSNEQYENDKPSNNFINTNTKEPKLKKENFFTS